MIKESRQIGDTPLRISVYSVEKARTKIHGAGILEIIFCLKGSVKFSYAYEEFTLHAGEYISVDKDAYYFYDGRDSVCVSLYFDLGRYKEKYPFICNTLFVCEGVEGSGADYARNEHNMLRGMMIALLKFIIEGGDIEKIAESAERIVDMFVEHFDIFFFHALTDSADREMLAKVHEANDYMHNHMKEKITIRDLAGELNFTEGYMSEFLRKASIGFREMLGYIRANASETYLLETDKTILEISEECGFSDVKYYYSAFKKWYKCTPKQFREKYGKEMDEKIVYMNLEEISELLDKAMLSHYMETFLHIKNFTN